MLIKNDTEANNQLALRLLEILVNTPQGHDYELYATIVQELCKSTLYVEGSRLHARANNELTSCVLEILTNISSDNDAELYEDIAEELGISTICMEGITLYAEGINL